MFLLNAHICIQNVIPQNACSPVHATQKLKTLSSTTNYCRNAIQLYQTLMKGITHTKPADIAFIPWYCQQGQRSQTLYNLKYVNEVWMAHGKSLSAMSFQSFRIVIVYMISMLWKFLRIQIHLLFFLSNPFNLLLMFNITTQFTYRNLTFQVRN